MTKVVKQGNTVYVLLDYDSSIESCLKNFNRVGVQILRKVEDAGDLYLILGTENAAKVSISGKIVEVGLLKDYLERIERMKENNLSFS